MWGTLFLISVLAHLLGAPRSQLDYGGGSACTAMLVIYVTRRLGFWGPLPGARGLNLAGAPFFVIWKVVLMWDGAQLQVVDTGHQPRKPRSLSSDAPIAAPDNILIALIFVLASSPARRGGGFVKLPASAFVNLFNLSVTSGRLHAL